MIPLTVRQHNGQSLKVPQVFYVPEASLIGPQIPGTKEIGGVSANFTKVEYMNAGGLKSTIFCYESPLAIEALRNRDAADIMTLAYLDLGVAAAGTTQGNGTAITKTVTEFDAIGLAATEAADLPAATPGAHFIVLNNDVPADILKIFPAVGENIDGLADDAAYSLAGQKRVHFYCDVAGAWLVAEDKG